MILDSAKPTRSRSHSGDLESGACEKLAADWLTSALKFPPPRFPPRGFFLRLLPSHWTTPTTKTVTATIHWLENYSSLRLAHTPVFSHSLDRSGKIGTRSSGFTLGSPESLSDVFRGGITAEE